jgi:hypothetical protein
MIKKAPRKALILSLAIVLFAALSFALDYPHNAVNNISCFSCHYVFGGEEDLMPPWITYGTNRDFTQHNALCWSCHNEVQAPLKKNHSSMQADEGYGQWTVECRVCHNVHEQRQVRKWGGESYLYSGQSDDIQIDVPGEKSYFTDDQASWTDNEWQDMLLIPNAGDLEYGYKILSNTSDTLTVDKEIDLGRAPIGSTFAIIYGNLIQSRVILDKITDPMGC